MADNIVHSNNSLRRGFFETNASYDGKTWLVSEDDSKLKKRVSKAATIPGISELLIESLSSGTRHQIQYIYSEEYFTC